MYVWYVRMYVQYIQWNPFNLDTLGLESTVLIIEVSSFQGLGIYTVAYYSGILVPVVCVHIRGVSPIQGAGLEGCPQFRGLD